MVDHNDPNDSAASEEELKLAEQLRQSLESGDANDDADFLRALSLAHDPRELDAAENKRLVKAAIDRPVARKSNVVRVMFGVTTAIALAASVVLYFNSQHTEAPVARVELVPVRSTQRLFDKPFEAKSSASARIDRIASARESDLRENRFIRWGVR